MIPDYIQVDGQVRVRVLSTWSLGRVLERGPHGIVVDVQGDRISIHTSVIRRDVRKAAKVRGGRKCWISRDEFLTAVGVVNATVDRVRTGVRISTKYDGVADRIESMARGINANVLRTRTDDGTQVLTVKGFRPVPRVYIQTGARRRYFDSVDAARLVADAIHERTGIIVGIFNTSTAR